MPVFDPYVQAVREFHAELYGQKYGTLANKGLAVSRLRLMMEELGELACAMHEEDLVKTADGLADLLYVVFGTAELLQIPIGQCYRTVHLSNMTKDFKKVDLGRKGATKGPGYQPPDLAPILREAGLVL